MVKLVYTYALGAYVARRAGSSPVPGTTMFIASSEAFLVGDLALREQVLFRAPKEPSKNPKFILDFLRRRMVP